MKPFKRNWKIEPKSGNVATLHFDDISEGWEQLVMLSSDRHHDNSHCNRKLEKTHLDLARKHDAPILDFGDLFCVMQGPGDKRQSKGALLAEHSRDDYFNAIIEETCKDYAPYADLFAMIGEGNHETGVVRRYGINLTKNLVSGLNLGLAESQHHHRVVMGGYGGWVVLKFTIQKTVKQSMRLKYFHGAGGDSQVTKGVIETSRQAAYLPDADIVVNGHNHNSYHLPIARERLTRQGEVKQDIVDFVRTASYKDEYGTGKGGWHVETGKSPRPNGCAWLRLFYQDGVIRRQIILDNI